MLRRSIDTTNIIARELCEKKNVPHFQNWRLNERHYGKLTGYNRNNIQWTGDYFDIPPTNIDRIFNYTLFEDKIYAPEFGESHYMTNIRVKPMYDNLMHVVKNSQIPMICTHKNTARALMKNIEKFSEDKINTIHVPNATPIIYKFDNDMKLIDKIILSHEDFPHYNFD
jgi:2,3-bisphosphoglycerate-dependent phosphoglycerate mutase